jgi:hypothetical protein
MEKDKKFNNNNAQEISLSDLESYIIAPGEIFYQKEKGRPIKLFNAGQLIDHQKIQKYFLVSDKILIKRIVNPGNVQGMVQFLKEFKLAMHEKDSWQMRQEILLSFSDAYWKGIRPAGWLDLAVVGHRTFLKANSIEIQKMGEMGDDLFIRNSILAMVGVYLAIALGYNSTDFLSDFYHSILLKDWGLNECPSEQVMQIMEKQRTKGKMDTDDLLEYEKNGIQNHLQLEGDFLKQWSALFNDGVLNETLSLHHEFARGNGFALASHEDEWTDLDAVVVAIEGILPFARINFSDQDAMAGLKVYWQNDSQKNRISVRLFHIIGKMFDALPSLQQYYDSLEAA